VSFLDKFNNNRSHIISAYSRGLHNVVCNYFVEHILNTLRHQLFIILILSIVQLLVEQVDTLLVTQTIPDAIASNNNKLVVYLADLLFYFWKASNHLLFITLRRVLFILEIPKAARQSKTSIDSVFLHMPTSCNYSFLLLLVIRFMVFRQGLSYYGIVWPTSS